MASGLNVPVFICWMADHRGQKHGVDMAGDQVVDRRRAAAEWNVQHANAGFGGEDSPARWLALPIPTDA